MKLNYPFTGCCEIASVIDSSTITCGELDPFTHETLYCRKCLTTRLYYVEEELVDAYAYHSPSGRDYEEEQHRKRSAEWSRDK